MERDYRRPNLVASPEFSPRASVPSPAAWNEILARTARPPAALYVRGYFSAGLCEHGARRHRSRRLPASHFAPVTARVGDGTRRPPTRKKSAVAVRSRPALDPSCMRTSFRRRSLAGNIGDGGRGAVPPLVDSLSGGGDRDQSPGEELARRNFDGGRSAVPAHRRAANLEIF